MAEFIEKEVLTVREYDLYCHYVAGLVGIGLCQVCILCSELVSESLDDFSHMHA